MKEQITVQLIDVKYGKTKNWLTFHVLVDRLDKNKKYTLNFCGTELDHDLSLLGREIDEIKYMMCNDFGYAPFDIEKAKKVLDKGKSYTLFRGIEEN